MGTRSRYGQRTKDSKNLLQEAEQAHDFQSHPVQGWQGFPLRSGKTSLRQEAVRIRRTDQTRLPQEGQDHQEDRPQAGVPAMQNREHAAYQALQALRNWRREEEEGRIVPISHLLHYWDI